MSTPLLTLITGGARSGKSRFALEKARAYRRKIFIATAVATDPEMRRRIERHQKERGPDFVTVEEPLHLAEAIRAHAASADVLVVDCLTFWLNNLFQTFGSSPEGQGHILQKIKNFFEILEKILTRLVLVTNEINMGLVPADPLSREFVDQLGWLNQEVARRADEVILMVAGMPLGVKGEPPSLGFSALTAAPTDTGFAVKPSREVSGPPNEAFENWKERLGAIPPLEPGWRARARARLLEQTRPETSLGELERFLERIVAIQERERPSVAQKRIVVFAADHGVEEEGVSLYPKDVTAQMVYNFLAGGATINALARSVGVEVEVVDVGVDHDFGREPHLISRKIRRGTSNLAKTQALTQKELLQALEVGWERALQAKAEGVELLGIGEMGIANTTAASAVISALTKSPPEKMTGRGTGIDDSKLQHKIRVIEEALRVNERFLTDPFSILQSLGGFEIAAVTGCVIGAAHERIPCVIDGWIVSAGALVAIQLHPTILDYLFFAHESEETGHRLLLEELDVRPLLRLSLRLGEGTAACLALGILEAAVRAYNEVATFEEAQVARKKTQG